MKINALRQITTIFAIVLMLGSSAYAQSPEDVQHAKAYFTAGEVAFRLGNFQDAVDKFLNALRLVKRTSIMLNIGQCYRNLDNPKKSIFYYKLYLSEYGRRGVKTIPFHEAVKKHIAAMKQRLKEKGQEAKRDEEAKQERERLAKRNQQAELTRLKAEKAAEAKKQKALQQKANDARRLELEQMQQAEKDAQESYRKKNIWAFASLAVAVAAGITGGVLYGVGISRRDSAHERYELANDPTTIAQEWSDVESGQNMTYGANAMMAVAAISAGISIYNFVTRPKPGVEKRTSIAPQFGKTSWGLRLNHSF
jgi:tetratricopeptide (TPR) repeat protein